MVHATSLPPKDYAVFKQILKLYESKSYKKALKEADKLLAKHNNHGETLSMKGLILNSMNRKKEAYEYVAQGAKNNPKSHVCWHVYGLVYRGDRKYVEAIKCYKKALEIDDMNVQIYRDTSILQMQIRDYEGYVQTRQSLVAITGLRSSWVGVIVGQHLTKSYEAAISGIDNLLKNEIDANQAYERSELVLYQVGICMEAEKYEKALEILDKNMTDGVITDRLSAYHMKAKVLVSLGRKEEATDMYHKLVALNPENITYYNELEECLPVDCDLLQHYEALKGKYPRAHLPRSKLLINSQASVFENHMSNTLLKGFDKGLPTLFASVNHLYNDSKKVDVIENMVLGFLSCYNSTLKMDTTRENNDLPTVKLWMEYFLALHYDFLGHYEKALKYVDFILSHSPAHLDAYLLKARVYKHSGDIQKAADYMDQARELDLADRYLNTKCVRYLLKANRMKKAEEVVALFASNDINEPQNKQQDNTSTAPAEAVKNINLTEMQCMWYHQHIGDMYANQLHYGPALKQFNLVSKHFDDFCDDQLDFHSYCLRKLTLRAYVDTLRTQDSWKKHQFFERAATSAIKLYLSMYDNPKLVQENIKVLRKLGDAPMSSLESKCTGNNNSGGCLNDQVDESKMTPSELKKYKSKLRREVARKAAEAGGVSIDKKDTKGDKKNQNNNNSKDEGGETSSKVDNDPHGLKYIEDIDQKKAFLDECARFLTPLTSFSGNKLESQLLAIQVYTRQFKFLPALKALKLARKIDENDSRLFYSTVFLLMGYLKPSNTMNPALRSIFNMDLIKSKILPEDTSIDIPAVKDMVMKSDVNKFSDKSKIVAKMNLIQAKLLFIQDVDHDVSRDALVNGLFSLTPTGATQNWKDFASVLELLKRESSKHQDEIDAYKNVCKKTFPLCTVFH